MKFCFTSAQLSGHFANFFTLSFFRNLDGHFEQGIAGNAFISSYLSLQISKIAEETCFISGSDKRFGHVTDKWRFKSLGILSCVNWQTESNIAYNISFGHFDTCSHGNSPEVPYTEPQQKERSRNQPCNNLVLRSEQLWETSFWKVVSQKFIFYIFSFWCMSHLS